MHNALGLTGWTVHEIRDTEIMREYHATCDAQPAACPKCGVVAHLYRHGSKTVRYVDAPSWGKQSLLVVKVQRYRCRSCDTTFMQRLSDVDDSRQMTKRCMAYIEQQGVPQTFAALSRHIGVDEKTVRMVCHEAFAAKMADWKVEAPWMLGMDELMLAGAARAIFVDIGQRRTLDILPCRKQRPVAIWLDTLPHKERVQLVAIDMWRPYRDLIRTFLPNAAIVVDKFHIVRMANQALDRVRNDVRREGTTVKSRKNPRANRFLMQTGRRNLDPMESMRLDGMLANSPLFKAAWEAKERFYDVWQAGARADAERLYDEWQASIDPSVSHAFAKLVTSVTNWRNEIFAYFDYPVTNAYTEAVNGLIKIANRAGRSSGSLGRTRRADAARGSSRSAPSASTR